MQAQQQDIVNSVSRYQSVMDQIRSAHEKNVSELHSHYRESLTSLNTKIEHLGKEIQSIKNSAKKLNALAYSPQSMKHQDPEDQLSPREVRSKIQELIELPDELSLISLSKNRDVLNVLNLTELRQLVKLFEETGYWKIATKVQELIASKTKRRSDERALERTHSMLAAYENPLDEVTPSAVPLYAPNGPVLHIVESSQLDGDTGYTQRTSDLVRAQQQLGLPAIIVTQPGSLGPELTSIQRSKHQDIPYARLPGKSKEGAFLSDWLAKYVEQLELLTTAEKPSILHAHSDFLNAAVAITVGRRNNIPVVYEIHGFREETWLAKLADKLELGSDPHSILEPLGLPDAYSLRHRAENAVIVEADALISPNWLVAHQLKQRDRVASSTPTYNIPEAVASNEVQPQKPDPEIARLLNIRSQTLVIGSIASMTKDSGVDTLLRGFASLTRRSLGQDIHLLLVGDGPSVEPLKKLTEELNLGTAVTFKGEVSQAERTKYYSLIDILVAPQRGFTNFSSERHSTLYEVMAMSKPALVSDVSAHNEFLDPSNVVLKFNQSDHLHISDILEMLIGDKYLRAQFGDRARKWINKHRSWDVAARKTLEVYTRLGAEWPLPHIKPDHDSIELVSTHLAQNPPPTYGWFVLGGPKDSPEIIMNEGWRYQDHPRIQLDQPIEWERYPLLDRSLAFWLQGWIFMDEFFRNDRGLTLKETEFLIKFARGWNQARIERKQSATPDESMAYYDMALALRTPRLLILIAAANQFNETREAIPWMVQLLLHERQQLRKDESFTPRTNHGFYTAAAQLHLEKFLPELPDHVQIQSQATSRMALLINSQFAADGGHLEHSPAYHRLLLGSFISAVELGLITDSDMLDRLRRAQQIIGWMIQPNGELVGIGDTEAARPAPNAATKEPSTEWIITDGKAGEPTTSELLILPESGYAFIRSPQPKQRGKRRDSSYLAFQGGFHSRAHKHADDLSFTWFDRGQEILLDGGRWGYGPLLPPESPLRAKGFYYAAPERQYVESVRAHNTVELDGEIHDRRRKPYGSAIVDAEKINETFNIYAKAPQKDYTHDRLLKLTPQKELRIEDHINSSSEKKHTATAWFLLNGSSEILLQNERSVQFRLDNGDVLEICTTALVLDPIRGQENPLVGWRSTKTDGFIPAWSIGMRVEFVNSINISTSFRIVHQS